MKTAVDDSPERSETDRDNRICCLKDEWMGESSKILSYDKSATSQLLT